MNSTCITLLCISDHLNDFFKEAPAGACVSKGCLTLDAAFSRSEYDTLDLILIDGGQDLSRIKQFLSDRVFLKNKKFRPTVFMVSKRLPEKTRQMELMKAGIHDFFVFPVDTAELEQKFEVYRQLHELEQQCRVQRQKAQKQVRYLEKFKKELSAVKSDLYDERLALNNALKQIQQLTENRRRLKKEKKQLKEIITKNMEGFFNILCDLVKVRVEQNRGHGLRVARIAEFVGKELGLSENQLEDLRKAAMLHEIGLMFAPPEVVKKPVEERDENEAAVFVNCSAKSADLLSMCSEFDNCARIIGSMYENADGTGSPDRLKRRYIPMASRILAGADLFDSLRDDKTIKGLEELLGQLETYSGSRLDPGIVSLLEKYAVSTMASDDYHVRGVGVHELEPGMILGTAIYTNSGTKLFSVNTLLTRDAIDKIQKYNREYPVEETVYIRV